MKIKGNVRKAMLLGICVTTAAALLVAGCGGGGGRAGTTTNPTVTGLALVGAVTDGYVGGATVTLDVNDDRICSATEPTTTTNSSGGFTFTATQNPNGGQHMTCATGGTDLSTGLPLKGQLLAPPGATQITPLTNVVMAQVNSPPTAPPVLGTPSPVSTAAVATASTNLASNLGITLPAGQTLTTADPVALATTNPTLLQATVAVQVLLAKTADAVSAATTAPSSQANQVYQNAANSLAAALFTPPAIAPANPNAALTGAVTNSVVTATVTSTKTTLATAAAASPTDTALAAASTSAAGLSSTSVAAFVAPAVTNLVTTVASSSTTNLTTNNGSNPATAAQSNVAVANSTSTVASLLTTTVAAANTGAAATTLQSNLATLSTTLQTQLASVATSSANTAAAVTAINTAITTATTGVTVAPAAVPVAVTATTVQASTSLQNVVPITSVAINGTTTTNTNGALSATTAAGVGIQTATLNLGLASPTTFALPATTDVAFSVTDSVAAHSFKVVIKGLTVTKDNVNAGAFTLSGTGTSITVFGANVSTGLTGVTATLPNSTVVITSTSNANGSVVTLNVGTIVSLLNAANPVFSALANDTGTFNVTAVVSSIPLAVSATVAAANQTIAIAATNFVSGSSQSVQVVVTPKLNQTISFGAVPTILVGGSGTVSAQGGASGNPVTFSSTTPTTCTVSGALVTAGNVAGACIIAADQAGNTTYNAAAQAKQTITIGAAAQTISFGTAPTIAFGGSGSVSATATSNLAVTYSSTTAGVCSVNSSTGVVTDITAGTCTIAANQAGNSNFNVAAQVTQNIIIGKASQTITFGTAPTVLLNGSGTVTATATSGLAVTFTSTTTNVCSITGSSVTATAAGPCIIAANQAGGTNYNAAPQVTQTITVSPANQVISFGTAPAITFGGTGSVSATATSNLAVTYSSTTTGVCSVNSSTGVVTDITAGTCTIAANQAGNGSYNAATQVTQNITIGKATQTITGLAFTPNTLALSGTTTVSATKGASSSPLVFSSTTPAVCTVTGGTTVTALTAGACIIAADQAADTNYTAATQVTKSITVGVAGQTIVPITFNPTTLSVAGTTTASATGGASGNAVTFTSSTPSVCTATGTNGSTITGVTAGTCTIAANQLGNGSYNAAGQVTQNITVTAIAPGAPTGVSATAGNASATVSFTTPASTGGSAITGYTVTPYVGTTAGTPVQGATSPITVTGLLNGTSYTFTVTANNGSFTSAASSASAAVTPSAPVLFTTGLAGTLGDGYGLFQSGAGAATTFTFNVTVSGVGSSAKPFTASGFSGFVKVNSVIVDPSVTPINTVSQGAPVDALAKDGDVIQIKITTPPLTGPTGSVTVASQALYTAVINFENPTTGALVAPTFFTGVCTGLISGVAALPPSVPAGSPFPTTCP